MAIYYCRLTLHDNVFFATREMGILYETEKYLHNWALSYAFFAISIISQPYCFHGQAAQTPDYLTPGAEQTLLHLNDERVYVFPAKPLRWSYQINTFKAAQTTYYGKSKQFGDKGANRNYPINYGRAKELAVGSEYDLFIIGPDDLKIPRWIRLGKWMGKVRVETIQLPESVLDIKSGQYWCDRPLNPIDLPATQEIIFYNRIVMPPVSLMEQVTLRGPYYQSKKEKWKQLKQQYPKLPEFACL